MKTNRHGRLLKEQVTSQGDWAVYYTDADFLQAIQVS